MSVLTLRALSKSYGRIQAVDGVDLVSGEGELLAILGPSGSGKSTIMRMVAGLEMPSSGDILIDGESVLGIPPKDRNVAMVFQSFALYPHMSVRDNILFPLVSRKLPKAQRQPKLDQVSHMLGIVDLLDRRPTRLSGGQQQKVALARALVRDPELFVFDEPLSSLDAKIRSSARAELRELHDRTGITMLYVTHDQNEALGLADRIAVINQGRLHQVGTPRELYANPADLFVAGFVGTPPMNLLPLDQATVAGLRPEHLRLAADDAPAGDYALDLRVTIEQLEYLGSEWLAYGNVHSGLPATEAPQQVIARLPSSVEPAFSPGETRRFVGTHEDVRWFDRISGKRKPAATGAPA
jgi:multiple sugar transport system ATP-binding protein